MLALAQREPRASSPPPLAAMASPVSVTWPRLGYGNKAFTGREWDPEIGLYYYRARYFDPKIGRFISEDPIGFAGGDVNLYAYVRGNPPNLVDPGGLQGLGPGYGALPIPFLPPRAPRDPTGPVQQEAWRAESRNFPGVPDPYGGGFRHCMSACLLKRRYGPAGEAMTYVRRSLYEDARTRNEDSAHDASAEERGFRCSAGGDSCEQECLKWFPVRGEYPMTYRR